MKQDFLKDLHYLGVTARLKRISDTISYNIKDLYKQYNLDIEPSWHLIFLLLKKYETSTMTEISNACNISIPGILKICNRMKKKGYLLIAKDKRDNRRKLLILTEKAHTVLPGLEKIWDAGQKSIMETLKDNPNFLDSLEKFELELENKSFRKRVTAHLKR